MVDESKEESPPSSSSSSIAQPSSNLRPARSDSSSCDEGSTIQNEKLLASLIAPFQNELTKPDLVKYRLLWRTLRDVALKAERCEKEQSERYKSVQRKELEEEKLSLEDEGSLLRQESEEKEDEGGSKKEELDRLEEEVEKAQLELEKAERAESVSSYELHRLEEERSELVDRVDVLKVENEDLVKPELERLQAELQSIEEEKGDIAVRREKDVATLTELEGTVRSIRNDRDQALEKVDEKITLLANVSGDPKRIHDKGDVVVKDISSTKEELETVKKQIKTMTADAAELKARKAAADGEKKKLDEKVDTQSNTVEYRRGRIASITKNLDMERTRQHSLAASRLELEVSLKEMKESIRHKSTAAMLERKELELAKRSYVKKRQATDKTRQINATLKDKIQEHEDVLRTFKKEHASQRDEIEALKREVDVGIVRLVKREDVEKSMRDELDSLMEEVEETEAEMDEWRADEGKLAKIISILNAQREVKQRKAVRIMQDHADAMEQVKLKKLFIRDLTKTCHETNKRIKELSALYTAVENERNECTALIGTTEKALVDMKVRIESMQSEMAKLQTESAEKSTILSKERDSHENNRGSRAALRAERNNVRSAYREKQDELERQAVEVEKLNSTVSSLQRDMARLTARNDQLSRAKQLMADQLEDRKRELYRLYQRANLYEHTLKRGEVALQQRKEDIRMLELQRAEVKRQLEAKKRNLPNAQVCEEKIDHMQKELEIEKLKTKQLCKDLEDPKNEDRWTDLGSNEEEDNPEEEHLLARIGVLERRLSDNKETLLEKELILEEVTGVTEDLKKRATSERNAAQPLVRKLNENRAKVQTITRSMMALVSELSMYQATALKLEEERSLQQEALEEAQKAVELGDAPSEEAARELDRIEAMADRRQREGPPDAAGMKAYYPAKHSLRTTAEPRPTAYIPDEVMGLGLPKPFGAMAPFKPTVAGSTMRHIRTKLEAAEETKVQTDTPLDG